MTTDAASAPIGADLLQVNALKVHFPVPGGGRGRDRRMRQQLRVRAKTT